MISTLFKSFKLTIAFSLLFSICYIFVLWIFAQVAGPNKGNAEVLELNGKVVGAANVGQNFTEDIYFWGRPSYAGDGYDASSSAGSNKGPSNEEYLSEVKARIDTFLVHHPYLTREEVHARRNGHRQRFRTRPRYLPESRLCTSTTCRTGPRPLARKRHGPGEC